MDSCDFCPFFYAKSVAMQGKHMVCPSITALVCGSCPNTVISPIAIHILHPFQGMLRARANSHVGQEGFKRVLPCWADGDATSAIVSIVRRFGIQTSLFHVNPYRIFCGLASAMREVAKLATFHSVSGSTATTLTRSSTQMQTEYQLGSATEATTTPPPALFIRRTWATTKNGPLPTRCIGKINKRAHDASFAGVEDGQDCDARRAPQSFTGATQPDRSSLAQRAIQ